MSRYELDFKNAFNQSSQTKLMLYCGWLLVSCIKPPTFKTYENIFLKDKRTSIWTQDLTFFVTKLELCRETPFISIWLVKFCDGLFNTFWVNCVVDGMTRMQRQTVKEDNNSSVILGPVGPKTKYPTFLNHTLWQITFVLNNNSN